MHCSILVEIISIYTTNKQDSNMETYAMCQFHSNSNPHHFLKFTIKGNISEFILQSLDFLFQQLFLNDTLLKYFDEVFILTTKS